MWDAFLTPGFELTRPNCSTTRWRATTEWQAAHNSQNQVYQNHVVRLLSCESVGIWRCLISEYGIQICELVKRLKCGATQPVSPISDAKIRKVFHGNNEE